MTMRKIIFTALLIGSLALAGCSDPPTSGVVTHKQHSDAYSYVTTHCGAYNSKGSCTVWIPVVNHMPATWELCLRNLDDKSHDAEGCREVGEVAWNQYQEGDRYPRRDPQ